MPDLFVPVEEIYKSRFFVSAYRFIPSFIYHYIDKNGSILRATYTDMDRFEKYILPDDMLDQFFAFIAEKNIELSDADKAMCTDYLQNRLRAEVARLIINDNAFYSILYQNDPMVLRAWDEIKR